MKGCSERQEMWMPKGGGPMESYRCAPGEFPGSARAEDFERRRVSAAASNGRALRESADKERLLTEFSEICSSLSQINSRVRCAERQVAEDGVRKASSRFIELYNIVADTRESTWEAAVRTRVAEVEDAACNMGEFLDMICEYLSDYGIRTICSSPGEPFSPKEHAAEGEGVADPRNAVVVQSVRRGFAWGEQVVQKERVRIEAGGQEAGGQDEEAKIAGAKPWGSWRLPGEGGGRHAG